MKHFLFLLAVIFGAVPAQAGELPIFDTHMHYSSSAWDVYAPGDILKKLDTANITRALVSSTPDAGTMKLFDIAPGRVVPALRPYRTRADMARWYETPDVLAYSKDRLAAGRHKALGEIHLYMAKNLETPEMAEYLDMAVARGLIVQPHTDALVVEALFKKRPKLKILWAHAGFSEPALVVARMLDQYPNLWAELSYRAGHIQPDDDLDPEWKALLIRHAGRFTIGSDTWEVDRWHGYQGLINEHREWLRLLPPDVAEKIAFRNAEGLFPQQ
ncbi:MAG: amidohydrolase family protein [Rhodospirillales bacterium]|nr:amidohydrolase family protein [Rhodospirillales bacterium]